MDGRARLAANPLSLGAWVLLGAFLIQVRGQRSAELQQDDARILALSDGLAVTITGCVMWEGYARFAVPRSIRESVDVETEAIASQGESWPVRAGVRLSLHSLLRTLRGSAFTRSCIRRAITAIPGPSIMKATCATTASACLGRQRRTTLSGSPGFPAAGSNSGERAFTRVSWPKFTSCGPRRRPR